MIGTGTFKKLLLFASAAAVLSLPLLDCRSQRIKTMLVGKRLDGENLSGIDFYNSELAKADFSRSKLINANFSFADLTGARFVNADLRYADLGSADLSGADFRGSNLRNAVLRNAILKNANLIDAYCYGADLTGADLRGALLQSNRDPGHTSSRLPGKGSLYYAHMRGADLAGTAISISMKEFIAGQNVNNFDKIIWTK